MSKEFPLKLSQRGLDAREEVPMRTPKRLYAAERIIYQPELLTCLHCGALLVLWNYLAWDKTVQTLDGLLSIATRPGRCPHATCPGSRIRLLSAAAQRMAPPGSTYGYDVLVRLGWLRQYQRATYSEIHTELSCRVPISESHVRYLYQHVYLPLLACHERQQRGRLAQVAREQGGLIVALDGLAPQGGEPQIWCIRDLSTGLTLRSGWLAQLDQPTFEAFLAPLRYLEWPILAVLSDKQTGLVPAVATALPGPLSAEFGRAARRRRYGLQGGVAQHGAPARGHLAPAGTPEAMRPCGRLDSDRRIAQPCRSALGTGWPMPSACCRPSCSGP